MFVAAQHLWHWCWSFWILYWKY